MGGRQQSNLACPECDQRPPPMMHAEEHASIATTHGGSSAKNGMSWLRVSLRAAITISPFASDCVNLKAPFSPDRDQPA